nr:NAD(+) diphosphatase [Cellvibrionaceae bacterium]
KIANYTADGALYCDACDLTFYPRISPCVMCLIVRDDYCLLAHHHRHRAGMYSTLAGFVEAGESLEDTLVREVKEEVGIGVNNIRYFASQSWPLPHQLMVGYFADYDQGEIVEDGEEIVDAQWFHYTKLPATPPNSTLSGQLIAEFVKRCSAGV